MTNRSLFQPPFSSLLATSSESGWEFACAQKTSFLSGLVARFIVDRSWRSRLNTTTFSFSQLVGSCFCIQIIYSCLSYRCPLWWDETFLWMPQRHLEHYLLLRDPTIWSVNLFIESLQFEEFVWLLYLSPFSLIIFCCFFYCFMESTSEGCWLSG